MAIIGPVPRLSSNCEHTIGNVGLTEKRSRRKSRDLGQGRARVSLPTLQDNTRSIPSFKKKKKRRLVICIDIRRIDEDYFVLVTDESIRDRANPSHVVAEEIDPLRPRIEALAL